MSIPIPARLQRSPKWHHMPVPYIALIGADGQPDFRAVCDEKRRQCIGERLCQLCGQKLGKFLFFVGGPEAAKAGQYFEPAAHLDCVIYAMQVCPFILGKMEHADIAKVAQRHEGTGITVRAADTFSSVRNPHWVIIKATDYDLANTPDGLPLVVPKGIICLTPPLHAETMSEVDWQLVHWKLNDAQPKIK